MKKHHKVIFVGDSSCGKSSMIKCLKKEEFSSEIPQTLGTEIYSINQVYKNIKNHYKIYDTSGCEAFQIIIERLLGQVDAAIVCFDASKKCYIEQIREWIRLIEMQENPIQIYLIGNKLDLMENQPIDVISLKYPIFFTSCKNRENITEVFDKVFLQISEKQKKVISEKLDKKPHVWNFCSCCFHD